MSISDDDLTAGAGNSQELAEQIYDMLMAEIEPDLMLSNLPLLDEKYKSETDEERQARMARYEESYKEFDKQFNDFMLEVNEEVRTSKRESLENKEERARTEDLDQLASLEAAFT